MWISDYPSYSRVVCDNISCHLFKEYNILYFALIKQFRIIWLGIKNVYYSLVLIRVLVLESFLVWNLIDRPQYWSFYYFLQCPEATASWLFPHIFLAPSVISLSFVIKNWGYVHIQAMECDHRMLRWKWFIKFYQEQKNVFFIISVHNEARVDKMECILCNATAILLLMIFKICRSTWLKCMNDDVFYEHSYN
jgi:hypothetical protein